MNDSDEVHQLLNVGKTCFLCKKIDFLTYNCENCKKIFCYDHCQINRHGCEVTNKKKQDLKLNTKCLKIVIETNQENFVENQKTKVSNVTEPQQKKKKDHLKIQDFKSKLEIIKLKFFKKYKWIEKAKNPQEVVGEDQIENKDRLHLFCMFLKNECDIENKKKLNKFLSINKKKFSCIFVSKHWSVGRALDSISDFLNASNFNNVSNKEEEKLKLYYYKSEILEMTEFSDICEKVFDEFLIIILKKG